MILDEFNAVLDHAKQQRAETIGAGVRKHPVASAVASAACIIVIPVMFTVPWSPSASIPGDLQHAGSLTASQQTWD